jgi:hypothetical protein
MMTKIYSLQDENGNIRYIGKTSRSLKERFSAHLLEARNGIKNHRCNWIRSIISNGKWPSPFLIGEVEGDGCKEEIAWIAYFRVEGVNLVNETKGGEGMTGWKPSKETCRKMSEAGKGRIFSEEHKRKIGEAHKGNKNNLGRRHSPETLLKMSAAQKGNTHFLGHHHSDETKEKISKAHRGKIRPDEWRLNISKGKKGKATRNKGWNHSEETKRKISIAQKNYQQHRKDKLQNNEATP